jgi:ATPase family AAA domain-containing protein 2
MHLDQVNDRLWNGYYLTPSQFVFDIQCMVHDSKAWPDRDRTNRAEEMLVNTQTYVSEVFDETLVLECERLAEREFERQKIIQAEREAKAKKKAEREKEKERLRLAASQQAQEGQSPSKSAATASGHVQMVDANGDHIHGLGLLTNGTSTAAENSFMDDTGSHVIPESLPFGSQQLASQSQIFPTTTSTSPTHTQPFQPMPAANGNLIPTPAYNAYPTHIPHQPQYNQYSEGLQGQHQYSQFPGQYPYFQAGGTQAQPPYGYQPSPLSPTSFRADNTQSTNQFTHQMSGSQPSHFAQHGNQLYQPPHTPGPYGGPQPTLTYPAAPVAPPQTRLSPTRQVLPRPSVTPHPTLNKDPARVEILLQEITRHTEGYSLEQLEQVYAACMDIIWRLRHEWDRTVVITETEKCVNRIVREIEMMQTERQRDRLGN